MRIIRTIAIGVIAGVMALGTVVVPVQAAGVVQGALKSTKEVPTYDRTITTGAIEYLAGGGYVDKNDRVYALNAKDSTGTTNIIAFNPTGTVAATIPYPSGYNIIGTSVDFISGDEQGNIYVTARDTESSTHHVLKLSQAGAVLQVFGDAEAGQIHNPYGLTVDGDGNVYVAHAQGYSEPVYRVSKFAANGSFTSYVPAFTEEGYAVRGVAADASGTVYAVLQQGFEATYIRVVSKSGQFVRDIQTVDEDQQRFLMSFGVTVGPDGGVYTLAASEDLSAQVVKYAPTGEYLGEAVAPHNAELYGYTYTLGVDSKGAIYAPQPIATREITRFSAPTDMAVFTANQPGGRAEVVVSAGELDQAEVSPPEALGAPVDAGRQYPLGIVSFTASVPDTDPVTVTYRVVSDLQPNEVTLRKYNAVTKQYTNVPNATVTKTTMDGEAALQVTYQVVDGGALDEDGEVNGVIVDPVGLAVAAGSVGGDDGAGGSTGGGTGTGGSTAGGAAAGGELIPGVPNTAAGLQQMVQRNWGVLLAGVLAVAAAGAVWFVRNRRAYSVGKK